MQLLISAIIYFTHTHCYCIGHVGERKCDAIFVNVNVCDQPLKMEVDTGAKVSAIPASIFSVNAK